MLAAERNNNNKKKTHRLKDEHKSPWAKRFFEKNTVGGRFYLITRTDYNIHSFLFKSKYPRMMI